VGWASSPCFGHSLATGINLGAIYHLALWIAHWLFRLIRGKEGMGYGDSRCTRRG
jgi:hypothetical protein